VALIGMAMTLIVVPDIRETGDAPVDVKGIVLIGPAIFALMFGLESAIHPHAGWQTPALLIAAAILFWLFLRHVRRVPAPVFDLTLLRIDSFRHSIVTGAIFRTIALATGFILPLWFQLAMGMSAAKTGAILVVSSIGTIVSRLAGVKLTQVVHPRTVAIGGASLVVLALLLTAQLDPGWPLPAFYAVLGIQAVTISIGMMVVSAVAYVDIAPGRMAQAAGLFTTIQQLTMSLGITLGVWTISGMKLFYAADEHDGRIYSASLVILAALAVAGALTTRKLDVDSVGQLQGKRQGA
jgi:hypothetical protein